MYPIGRPTAILDAPLPATAGEDSFSMLRLFQGHDEPIRDQVVHHSISGKFAIRDQRWKLVLCPGSGGWTLNDADAVRDGHRAYASLRYARRYAPGRLR